MNLSQQIEYLRIEAQATRELLTKLELALERVARQSADDRRLGLEELRRLDHGLLGVLDHCHSRDRVIESMPSGSLTVEELQRSASQHQQLARAINDFRFELKFSTIDHVSEITASGRALLAELRLHVEEESIILNRIEQEQLVAG